MTVIDSFSKMAIFVPLIDTGAVEVAKEFFSKVVTQMGMPAVIVSDRDPRFTGEFWKALMAQFRTKLHFSTAYHPQIDGKAEVTNRTLGTLLRTHCQEHQDWVLELSLVQMVYNATP